MKRTCCLSLWLCGWLLLARLPGAEPKNDGADPDYAAELPRIAPKSPEGFGESIGADLNAIRDRGSAAVLLNIVDPNREVKPQFLNYVVALDSGRTVTGMIAAETANSLTIRKPDNTTETILRVDVEELKSTGLSFMPEGLEKQLDPLAIADLLAYLNSIK